MRESSFFVGTLKTMALVVAVAQMTSASAQKAMPPGELAIDVDENGVNLISFAVYPPDVSLKIGDFEYTRQWRAEASTPKPLDQYNFDIFCCGGGYLYNESGQNTGVNTCYVMISLGYKSKMFDFPCGYSNSNTVFTPRIRDGSTLTKSTTAGKSGSPYQLVYTERDGTSVIFPVYSNSSPEDYLLSLGGGHVNEFNAEVIRPNGEYIKIIYSELQIVSTARQIISSKGYQVVTRNWSPPFDVTVINQGFDYCSTTVSICGSLTYNWPRLSISFYSAPGDLIDTPNNTTTVIEPTGVMTEFVASTTYSSPSSGVALIKNSVRRNGSEIQSSGGNGQSVLPFSKWNNTWTYNFLWGNPSTSTYISNTPTGTLQFKERRSRIDPLGKLHVVEVDPGLNQVLSLTDENGGVQRRIYEYGGRLQYAVFPEGAVNAAGIPTSGFTKYDYDARGNVLQTTVVPKAGSGLANIVTTAGFDATCSNPKTCNQPNWTKDAKGNQTDFTYSPEHGGLLTEMKPAPSAGTARPLTVKTYAQRYAWIKNAAGALVQNADAVWMPVSVTQCQTQTGANVNTPVCDPGLAPELKTVTTNEYGAPGTPESLLVKGVAVTTGGTTLRTCYTYDIYQNRTSETQPKANLAACP